MQQQRQSLSSHQLRQVNNSRQRRISSSTDLQPLRTTTTSQRSSLRADITSSRSSTTHSVACCWTTNSSHAYIQTVPYNLVTAGIGPVRLDHQLSWEHLLDSVPSSLITLDSPAFMEHLNTRLGSGQQHGWIVYRTRVSTERLQMNISGTMRDRALVYLDGRLMETVYNNRLLPFVVVMSLYHRLTASRVATIVARPCLHWRWSLKYGSVLHGPLNLRIYFSISGKICVISISGKIFFGILKKK